MLQMMLGLTLLVLAEPSDCIEDRDALLALSQQEFDQDLEGGWRAVAMVEGCREDAADLIAEYRSMHGLEDQTILWWHEGQVRAGLGQTDRAIELFQNSVKPDDRDFVYDTAWNYYVDATIAYLEQDREALITARDALKALPKPDGYEDSAERFEEKYGYRPAWPQNLDVVEGLVTCFDKPYSEAYGSACRPSAASD